MLKILTVFCFFFLSCLAYADQASLYQVDVIVFTHQNAMLTSDDLSPTIPNVQHAIPLEMTTSEAMTPYHLMPASYSHLRNEYWALNHKSNYQVLFHYTWLQPSNNQRPIVLPISNRNGWNVEGTLRVRQSNYYLLDTNLVFSTPCNQSNTFAFSQKQRLKAGTVYYLDHPQAGMLIKVQRVG